MGSGKVFRGCSDTPSEASAKRSADLQKEVAAFLKAGGKIQSIPIGVSVEVKPAYTIKNARQREYAKNKAEVK